MVKRLLCLLFFIVSLCQLAVAVELKLDQESIQESGQYNDDYLFAGEQLSFSGKARDLFFFGEKLDFSGNLDFGLYAGGRSVHVIGDVGNGIKAGAQSININGRISGTSLIGAEEVVWDADHPANGDTFIGARVVNIKSKINGDIYIGAGEVFIEDEITGNAQVRTGQLKIGEKGKINGDLVYYSDQKLSPEEAGRVTGSITYVEDETGIFKESYVEEGDDGMPIWFRIIMKLALALVGLIVLLLPVTKGLEKQQDGRAILSLSVWGLIPIFIYPALIVFSILLIITIPLAGVMILAFIPIFIITKTMGLTLIGAYLSNQFNLNINSRFLLYLIAVVLYSLLSVIPIAGGLLMIFVSSVGSGQALALLMKRPLGR